ncbi:HNH endonuclease [Streptomyces mutomycini]|uniref:HNH endonuclease n=1 Tax=Streptomyces mutomycini TaxID=284036 RepID=UPI0033E58AA7
MTSEGDLTTQQWREILDEYDDLCAYCDEPYSHIEHVLPLSRGGQHTASNVVPACSACNLSKGAKTPDEWISQLN